MNNLCIADSISIDGKKYDNVHIHASSSTYYIRIPESGIFFSVPKSKVAPDKVYINPDKKFRRKLLTQWREKAAKSRKSNRNFQNKLNGKKSNPEPESIIETKFKKNGIAAVDTGNGVTLLTGNPDKYHNRMRTRPVFFDKNGVMLFTFKTEKYRENKDFVELSIDFEKVMVPAKLSNISSSGSEKKLYSEIITYYARHYNLKESLVYAVILCESNFKDDAVSRSGACGLMQLMPPTAAEMGITGSGIFDPAQNIAGGTQYLRKMINLFKGDISLALAAYNAGPGNVKKYGKIPPFKETQKYVAKVQRTQKTIDGQGIGSIAMAKKETKVNFQRRKPVKANFMLYFHNGLTQPADTIVEGPNSYQVIFENIQTQVRKEYVDRIVQMI